MLSDAAFTTLLSERRKLKRTCVEQVDATSA
jgi:hypothetical protein